MTKKPKLSSGQLLLMSVGSALAFPYTFMPILNAPPENQDVWIVLFVSIIYILLIGTPLLILMNVFRGFSANEILETIAGRILGKAAAVIFSLFFIYCFAASLLIAVIYINLFILPDTPIWALLLYFVIPISYSALKGAGTIGRLAFFIVPFVILTVLFFFLLGAKDIDLSLLKPVLADSTFAKINLGGFYTGARYSEILIFFVFSYFLQKKSSINKVFLSAVGVFALTFFFILLPVLTHLGPELARHAWNPYFVYTRHVEGYDFIERVQAINTLAWFPVILLKLTIYNFMASYLLSNAAKAKSHRGCVVPISVFGALTCLIPILNKSGTVELLRSDQIFPFVVLPATFVLPLLLVIAYLLRRKKIKKIIEEKKRISSLEA